MVDAAPTPARPRALIFIGAALVMLGAAVILGWVLHIPALVRIVPGFAAMVFNTAACFILLGAALILAVQPTVVWRRRAQSVLGSVTIVIAALVLSQDLFSIDIGIDHLFSAAWLQDTRPHPTRMAPNSAVAFILAGMALLLLNSTRIRWAITAVQYLILAILLIGLSALFGYLLGLKFLFSWYPYARMAVHTALGFTLFGAGLWIAWRRARDSIFPAASPDERIILTGNIILIVMALVGSVSGFFVFGQQTEAILKRALRLSLDNQVDIYRSYLDDAINEANIIANRPGLLRELKVLQTDPGNADSLRFVQQVLGSFGELGISATALYDVNGRKLAEYGSFTRSPSLRVAVALPHQPELLWQDGLRLHLRLPMVAEGRPLGTLEVEHRLPWLDRMFNNLRGLGDTGEMVVCARRGERMACFPSRLQSTPYVIARQAGGQRLPMSCALDGAHGLVDTIDYRHQRVIAAYRPIYQTGLGMVIKIDHEELYAPLYEQSLKTLLVMIAVAVAGALLLRWQVLPLARRLVVAERATHEREVRFRALLEASPDAVVVTTADGHIELVNAQAETLFGYEREALIGQAVEILQPERFRVAHVEQRSSYTAQPNRRAMGSRPTLLGRRKDGSEFPIEISLSPLHTDHGLVTISAIRDVTERQQLQKKLQDNEQFLRTVVDNLSVALFGKDAQRNFCFTIWNNKSEEMFGLKREQVIGKNDYDIFPKEQADFFRRNDEEVMQQGHVVDIAEEPADSKSLGRITLHTRKIPVPDEQGEPHYLLGISEDITQRKRDENVLRASEARLRAVMESATDGIVTLTEHGLIESFNAAALDIFGYRSEQVIGQNIQMLMPASLRGTHIDDVQHYLDSGEKRVVGRRSVEVRGLRHDGSEFPLELGISEVWSGDKRLFIGILRDITERKQAEQTILELSLVDELTGLRNRRGFMMLAEAEFLLARRLQCGLVLFYADLDAMKAINDTYGHAEGDRALRDIADILRKTFRDSDLIARLGGDEFAVLTLNTPAPKPEHMLQRLDAALAEHNRSGARRYTLSLSIGAAHGEAGQAMSIDTLIARADAEMYRVKQARRTTRRS
ncbi:MAG: PAS domain S-box protein [Thiobacillus sp.]